MTSSRMSTNTKAISDDILKAAWDAAGHVYSPDDSPSSHSYVRDIIAKAIHDAVMAETERCARLMEDDGEWTFAGDATAMAIFEDVRELAADAIRATPKAEEE